jgi:[ribosomal protein S5]-alanine N-acetyltransferase
MNAPVDVSSIVLETPRLLLRPFNEGDLADLYAYASVPNVGEWAGWKHHESLEESKKILTMFIEEKKTFALFLKESGHVVGSLGLERYRCPLPKDYDFLLGRELGYVLAKSEWGKGLMSEAVYRVILYCFDDCHLDFLTCGHFARNNRSRRVIEKNGFRYLGKDDYLTAMGTHEEDCYYVLDNPNRKK